MQQRRRMSGGENEGRTTDEWSAGSRTPAAEAGRSPE